MGAKLTSLTVLPKLMVTTPTITSGTSGTFVVVYATLILFVAVPKVTLFCNKLVHNGGILSVLARIAIAFTLIYVL